MGKVASTIRRAIRNYDVEHRALEFIKRSTTRAQAAPKHPNTHRPSLDEATISRLFSHNPELDHRIDKISIRSFPVKEGILPDGVDYVKESTRRLPQRMDVIDAFPDPHVDFGFVIPESIPSGRITMRQAINIIKAYQLRESTLEELMQSTAMEKDKLEAITKHFALFTVPTSGYWLPPSLLPELVGSSQLLDKPIDDQPMEEPIGGAVHFERREAFLKLEDI